MLKFRVRDLEESNFPLRSHLLEPSSSLEVKEDIAFKKEEIKVSPRLSLNSESFGLSPKC